MTDRNLPAGSTGKWTPSTSDVEWTRNNISMIKDGGVWVIPSNLTAYIISHSNKTLTLTIGKRDYLFDRISECCYRIGYKVVEAVR